MDEWNAQKFEEKMGNKSQYGVIVGKTCSGKTTVANFMANSLNMDMKVIDMKKIKKDNPPLDGEGNPVEGEECKLSTVEEIVTKMIKSEPSTRWVFDEYLHDKEEDFFNFIAQFGTPDYFLLLDCKQKDAIRQRYKVVNEIEAGEDGQLPEEHEEKLKVDDANFKAIRAEIQNKYGKANEGSM